ncbi:unnamed protein product [Rotaria sordida]|uniref:Uncharacterized protein n=1 Tax=Rotaria sordida TaxID=392033 RepID=A0A814L5T5_9BILA|nr:unnamed protein product [Rotaria sordida]CAF0950278.1 unnamed protein product [Rotaria sordida]CAF1061554.1 unnamed protein product [Rotaria sordida]CAF1213544.1 unnamed protein product [Rotaria sordida]CAF1214315.1 unnamed protein product [Rotaria sordida]
MINNCLSMVIPSTTTIIDDDISNITTTTTITFPTTIINDTKINQTATPTHILRVRIRVHNSLIETLVHQKQLDLIEIQLQQRHIPYRQIQDNKDGITIIIGPYHKSINFTAPMIIFNQSRFHRNFTKMISIKHSIINEKNETITKIQLDEKRIQQKHFPIRVEAHEYNLVQDQESSEFRNCLEACDIYQGNELKPNHNCIRKNCLKEITGI